MGNKEERFKSYISIPLILLCVGGLVQQFSLYYQNGESIFFSGSILSTMLVILTLPTVKLSYIFGFIIIGVSFFLFSGLHLMYLTTFLVIFVIIKYYLFKYINILEDQNSSIEQQSRNKAFKIYSEALSHRLNNSLQDISTEIEKKEIIEHLDLKGLKSKIKRLNKEVKKINRINDENDVRVKKINIQEFFQDLFNLLDSEFKLRKISIDVKIDNVELILDPELFKEAILNMITNIFEYYDRNSEELKYVSICTQNKQNGIKLIISNSGTLEINKAKIFEPFVTKKEIHNGNGLGLTVSKKIIKNLGGDIILKENKRRRTISFEIHLVK
tara:strand:- start:803 stop:1789 length:987 start_codon:yes stop_codon:yes gene_type:complete